MSDGHEASRRERARVSLATFKEREVRRGSQMPGTFRAAFGAELAQAFSPPYQIPITVIGNAILMALAWFLLPRDWLFSVTSNLAFPMVLASWMYADVPATNVLAPDRVRSLAALDDWKMMNRLLAAKAAVLWVFVAPFCSLLAVLVGVRNHDTWILIGTLISICVIPVGCLPVAALVGIRWPYHPLQLKYRWEHRKPLFRMIVRWLILILIPYVLVPFLAVVMMIPGIIILIRSNEANSFLVNFVNGVGRDLGIHINQGTRPISAGVFTTCVTVTCGVAVGTWFLGRWANLRVIKRRRDKIATWLSDPTLG